MMTGATSTTNMNKELINSWNFSVDSLKQYK